MSSLRVGRLAGHVGAACAVVVAVASGPDVVRFLAQASTSNNLASSASRRGPRIRGPASSCSRRP
eukprot:4266845-Pyramimonas_sp.AAC.1